MYPHNHGAPTVAQRVKLTALPIKMERLAHVTNHIFEQGFLVPRLRTAVHWQNVCGLKLEEHVRIEDILAWGEGTCEDKPLRLVVDVKPVCRCACC